MVKFQVLVVEKIELDYQGQGGKKALGSLIQTSAEGMRKLTFSNVTWLIGGSSFLSPPAQPSSPTTISSPLYGGPCARGGGDLTDPASQLRARCLDLKDNLVINQLCDLG